MSVQPWKTKYVIGHLLRRLTHDHLEAWQTGPLTYKIGPNSLSWDILESERISFIASQVCLHIQYIFLVTEAQQCRLFVFYPEKISICLINRTLINTFSRINICLQSQLFKCFWCFKWGNHFIYLHTIPIQCLCTMVILYSVFMLYMFELHFKIWKKSVMTIRISYYFSLLLELYHIITQYLKTDFTQTQRFTWIEIHIQLIKKVTYTRKCKWLLHLQDFK